MVPSSQGGGGGILDLWEKLKLALIADFLISCISLRYCLCVSKCTLFHKLSNFVCIFLTTHTVLIMVKDIDE